MLPMFRELNVIGFVLEEEDKVKLRYLGSAITAQERLTNPRMLLEYAYSNEKNSRKSR